MAGVVGMSSPADTNSCQMMIDTVLLYQLPAICNRIYIVCRTRFLFSKISKLKYSTSAVLTGVRARTSVTQRRGWS